MQPGKQLNSSLLSIAGTVLYTGATGFYQEISPNFENGPSTAGQSTNGYDTLLASAAADSAAAHGHSPLAYRYCVSMSCLMITSSQDVSQDSVVHHMCLKQQHN